MCNADVGETERCGRQGKQVILRGRCGRDGFVKEGKLKGGWGVGGGSEREAGEKKRGHVTRPAARRCDQLSGPHLLVCFLLI